MINSCTYSITHQELKPYVQYVLFNEAAESGQHATSFSNDNICLGVLSGSELVQRSDGSFTNHDMSGISSYISGMYLKPHLFSSSAKLDEICIDFTPLGFYQFFNINAKRYIIGEDVITEAFGSKAKVFFEDIFQIKSVQSRGQAIEQFLLQHIKYKKDAFLAQALCSLNVNHKHSLTTVQNDLKCSSRKLQRAFKSSFDVTPKQYQRISRFRKSLKLIQIKDPALQFTEIAYSHGFNDQSHFVKEINGFTGRSPSQLKKTLCEIDGKVIVGV